jgi:mannose-1-phosphate guanylyltransferase
MRFGVILAGGGGTRLWPFSRQRRPKQLLPLGTSPDESLLAATMRRLAPICTADQVVVVTAAELAVAVRAELPEVPAANMLYEPVGRNTAAAIGLAAVVLAARDPDAVLAVLPSDHNVRDERRFRDALAAGFAAAEAEDVIVTLGIVPTAPETGFGYLELGAARGDGTAAVARFVEKPDRETARAYLASGRFLWNAGIFVARARRWLVDLAAHMPETWAGLAEIQAALARGGGAGAGAAVGDGATAAALAAAARVYPGLPAISIDYGVMERAADVMTVRGDFGWSDVGSWTALAEYRAGDDAGNVVQGVAVLHDAHRNIIVADSGCAVAVIGCDDLVVVKAGEAVLVVPRARAQEVREVVDLLRSRGLKEYL